MVSSVDVSKQGAWLRPSQARLRKNPPYDLQSNAGTMGVHD
jgi:hypothetical protein